MKVWQWHIPDDLLIADLEPEQISHARVLAGIDPDQFKRELWAKHREHWFLPEQALTDLGVVDCQWPDVINLEAHLQTTSYRCMEAEKDSDYAKELLAEGFAFRPAPTYAPVEDSPQTSPKTALTLPTYRWRQDFRGLWHAMRVDVLEGLASRCEETALCSPSTKRKRPSSGTSASHLPPLFDRCAACQQLLLSWAYTESAFFVWTLQCRQDRKLHAFRGSIEELDWTSVCCRNQVEVTLDETEDTRKTISIQPWLPPDSYIEIFAERALLATRCVDCQTAVKFQLEEIGLCSDSQ